MSRYAEGCASYANEFTHGTIDSIAVRELPRPRHARFEMAFTQCGQSAFANEVTGLFAKTLPEGGQPLVVVAARSVAYGLSMHWRLALCQRSTWQHLRGSAAPTRLRSTSPAWACAAGSWAPRPVSRNSA